jgi:hypothetical protein
VTVVTYLPLCLWHRNGGSDTWDEIRLFDCNNRATTKKMLETCKGGDFIDADASIDFILLADCEAIRVDEARIDSSKCSDKVGFVEAVPFY